MEGTHPLIENQITTTVIFPDATLPLPTNGGFATQEEFLKYIMNSNDGHWSSQLHVRPSGERFADYNDGTIADAFPLQFPFGFTGLAQDPAAVKVRELNQYKSSITRKDVILKYLTHRKPDFHTALFNLIMENIIMKEQIFLSSKIICNVKRSDFSTMGEQYGSMSASLLEIAIRNVRNGLSVQHSMSSEHQFLKSIRAACGHLPHSNEATMEARRTYFSFLIKFGLPSIFLTVTPDDLRNFRIVVYSLVGHEAVSGNVDVNSLTDEQIIADYKFRSETRLKYPGLCAEEYERIVHLVIKHLFNWDIKKQCSNGIGIFAEILAFTLATEEQGRKTLHGHFLLFVKGWKQILDIIQKSNLFCQDETAQFAARATAKAFYMNACSARLFSDFEPKKPLKAIPVFYHSECRYVRGPIDKMRYTVSPVPDQQLRDMRHQKKCGAFEGHIATCQKCKRKFSANEIVRNALNVHMSTNNSVSYEFPEENVRRLDRQVYEDQKNFSWTTMNNYSKAIRYFASNALVNMHFVTHTKRCFKKNQECFTNLPDSVCEEVTICFHGECDYWSDWLGRKETRFMFQFRPKRLVEDAFINTHNPTITSLLGINSNVLVGMNGRSVIYVTGYNAKSQQKEERSAFEQVSQILIKIIRNQVSVYVNIVF